MGDGLKKQWGVNDPAKGGSDKQAQQFKAAFQAQINSANGHLQYTSANAEVDKHAALASRRDALYPAFQAALALVDPKDPAKAKAAIDKVLADAKALNTEAGALCKAAVKALADWKARQPKFDAAVHQVEELETWGDAKAASLRTIVDGIRTQTNERRYASAAATVDQLLPKLKPIFDEYQKQKAAKPKYEQMLAEQSAKLDALKALEKPSQPMTAKAAEADTALAQVKAKADAKDYVGGTEDMKTVKTHVDALDKLAKDPARAKFLADRQTAGDEVNAGKDASFKSLEPDMTAMTEMLTQADTAADSGDYAGGNKLLGDLKTKLTAYLAKLEELKTQRQAYDDALAALQPQLAEFAKATVYAPLKTRADEITKIKGEMEAAAQKEDYVAALASCNDLKAKLDTYIPDLQKLQQAETDYKKAWATTEPKVTDALASARDLAALKASRDAVVAAKAALDTAVTAQDFEQAVTLVKDLETKADSFLKDVKVKEDEIKKKGDEVVKKIEAADDSDRDDIAREFVGTLTPDELKSMPSEVRNRLLAEMQDGNFEDSDKEGCKKLYSENYLDPEFEKLDDAKRKELIETMKKDPAFKEAREKWDTWPEDVREAKRIEILKKAADYQAEAFGIPKTKVEPYSPKNPDGTLRRQRMGEYDHDDGILKISREAMQDKGFDTVLDTVIHENGHRYQSTLIEKLDKGEIKKGDPMYNQAMTFKLNNEYYVQPKINRTDAPTPDRGNEYYTQPKEYHSRRNGEDMAAAGIGK